MFNGECLLEEMGRAVQKQMLNGLWSMLNERREYNLKRDGNQTKHLPLNIQHSELRICRVGIQLHIPIEIVTPAFRCVSNPDGNRHDRIPSRLQRFLQESHSGFLWCAAALLVVATPAGCHDILPGLSPSLGDGNDVIERQFLSPELVTTVLAGIAISCKDIDAGEFDRPVHILETHQLEEPHH